jgi:aspartyl-tRNA(Asn)/glutamyl-tRNA(Gln) amidotransferase subunit A
MEMELYRSLDNIRSDIRKKKTDLVSIVRTYLERAEEQKELNAFVEVFPEEAINSAKKIQEKFLKGNEGRLAGMVIGLKDNICYKGHIASAASRSLSEYRPPYSATAVQRLLDEDAIIIGRTNCDEFAMGGTNETSFHGPVKNPRDHMRVPGGSSGGSAAAVAAGLCLAAIGSDTGGSIRQPASFCGLLGLKPGYGRVSRYGLIAYGSSFDQIGPITWTAEDAALILEVIAGCDEFDSTASTEKVPALSSLIKGNDFQKKIAYLKEPLEHEALDPEIKVRMENIIDDLKHNGFTVDPVSFPLLDYLVPTYYVMAMAEASSNLARYDGIHFGHRSDLADSLSSVYLKSRSEGFGLEVKRRIMTGTFVLSAGYYDAYYGKAQKIRRLILEKTQKILSEYPFILLPTTPRPAFHAGTMGDDPVALYLEDIYTIHANLAGIPAISLPLGEHSTALPFGIQLMSALHQEAPLLSLSKYLMIHFQNSRIPG